MYGPGIADRKISRLDVRLTDEAKMSARCEPFAKQMMAFLQSEVKKLDMVGLEVNASDSPQPAKMLMEDSDDSDDDDGASEKIERFVLFLMGSL